MEWGILAAGLLLGCLAGYWHNERHLARRQRMRREPGNCPAELRPLATLTLVLLELSDAALTDADRAAAVEEAERVLRERR